MPTDLPESYSSRGDEPESAGGNPTPPPSGGQPAHDGGSFQIAIIAGIPVRIHITFLLLLVWFGLAASDGKKGSTGSALLFIVLLFACVLLHELSHSVVARRYGVKTVSITLYPIGGIAVLDRSPQPDDELWIALAGPAMNVIIAALLFGGLKLGHVNVGSFHLGQTRIGLAADLAWANLILGAFNMIPAFPMDGGRVLRSLIARVTDAERATQIAATVGQMLAIVFGIYALVQGDFMLFLVAAFVYLGAGQEANAHRMRTLVYGHLVREAMVTEFHTLTTGCTLKEAARALLAGSQHDFPVVNGDDVVGLLTRDELMRGIAAEDESGGTYVAAVMDREFPQTTPDADLETVLSGLNKAQTILVLEQRVTGYPALVGMLTQENAIEFLMLQQLARRRARPSN